MQRYRTFFPNDDPPLTDGDSALIGVNSFDNPENLEAGQAQAAVNMDFTTKSAQTRGGFVAMPGVGVGQFWDDQTAADNRYWSSVAYGTYNQQGVFVAVARSGGTTNGAMTSPDGMAWTGRTSSSDLEWRAVCYGNSLFVAVASDAVTNCVMTSPDGITWTTRAGIASGWRGIVYGNGLYVAVAESGTNRVMTSPDGITWTARTAASASSWQSVTYAAGLFVAVSATGAATDAMTSPDGITWTSRTTPTTGFSSIAYGNGLFVAVGGAGSVMSSPDGITWTARTAAMSSSWIAVTYGNGLFVSVAQSGTGNRTMTSPNGITWTIGTSGADLNWNSVVFGGDIFVAVAASGANGVMTSGIVNVFASGQYSDPDDPGSQWSMLVAPATVGFFCFGRQSRTVAIVSGQTVTEQSTIVQCDNQVYIFRGSDETPLYWTGDWSTEFVLAPTPTPATGFTIIPNSNQATFYQNRLWVIDGKDEVAASDVLDFTRFDALANEFNINTGSSDYLVSTFPFGTTTLIVFKNRSIIALTAVDGSLNDVVATEITRQVGGVGINSVVSVGPDLVYMSDRNINLLSLTSTSNAVQHKTLPLSRNIRSIIQRVNWNAASKVSMAYWDNKLYVALPLDNATSCNSVVVYNFVTEQWYGEWSFSSSLTISIQGWLIGTYCGSQRLLCVTENGRIYVTDEGQNDINGSVVAEIATSLTTRAYRMDNQNRVNRRMWADLGTNRPDFSVTAYADGASESEEILTNQTYSRTSSWIFNDAPYVANNSNDDYNRAFRKDYSSGPNSIQCGSGFQPEMRQDFRFPIITRRKGRLGWVKIDNATGVIVVRGVGMEARVGDLGSLVQVG